MGKKRRRNKRRKKNIESEHDKIIKKEDENPFIRTTRSMTSKMSAFEHNLKVKQEHLKDDIVRDVSFNDCYIFSMRCPYNDCNELFVDMTSYQSHHIQRHQQRDKKGKLVQSKEAKWCCPECGKVSASWYNYAAHVTMHKDACDAPWICSLPPVNNKKFVLIKGQKICGKRCSTKHNLIKHLKALHTNHRIVDLSNSVKARSVSITKSEKEEEVQKSQSPRKLHKKRPRFFHHDKNMQVPPMKKIKMDPDCVQNQNGMTLPIYSTTDNITDYLVKDKDNDSPHKSVQEQSDFVGLLLEAAQLIEKEGKHSKKCSNSPPPRPPMPALSDIPFEVMSSIKYIFDSNTNTLSKPISIEDVNKLSSVLKLKKATNGSTNYLAKHLNFQCLEQNEKEKELKGERTNRINISGLTNISSVSIPFGESDIKPLNNTNCKIMPNISIIPNMPSFAAKISPITANNPSFILPKMPLCPPPIHNYQPSGNGLDALLRMLNKPNNKKIDDPLPLFPDLSVLRDHDNNSLPPLLPTPKNLSSSTTDTSFKSSISSKTDKEDKTDNNASMESVISNNILSHLPPIVIGDGLQKSS